MSNSDVLSVILQFETLKIAFHYIHFVVFSLCIICQKGSDTADNAPDLKRRRTELASNPHT
jgi:hypothetical protein